MASKIISKGLQRTALSVALGMCFAGSVYAQSNSTGSIAGTTTAGATVVIENPATGFRREITAGADGGYRLSSLPTGTYKVTAGGQTRDVTVTIGGTATASLGTVQVVGGPTINAIDVASVESTTILTAEQIAKIPVARDITSVALLAPGTVKGDAAFGNLASFGGGAVSENQYFVNGFNITNAFKNLNFGQVPFEAIAEQQVKTGGYGAEFGRATGGVINLVTKRGSNEFHAGANLFWLPESLRGHNPDVYYNDARYPEGKRHVSDNSKDTAGQTISGSVWASGALIKDRLFGYALLQYAKVSDRDTYGSIFGTTSISVEPYSPCSNGAVPPSAARAGLALSSRISACNAIASSNLSSPVFLSAETSTSCTSPDIKRVRTMSTPPRRWWPRTRAPCSPRTPRPTPRPWPTSRR